MEGGGVEEKFPKSELIQLVVVVGDQDYYYSLPDNQPTNVHNEKEEEKSDARDVMIKQREEPCRRTFKSIGKWCDKSVQCSVHALVPFKVKERYRSIEKCLRIKSNQSPPPKKQTSSSCSRT